MGSSVCEHHYHTHKFHPLISPKQALQDLNIPPRKLLSRRSSDLSDGYDGDSSSMQKLSSSRESDVFFDTDDDPYSSDDFRMYEFKVRKCTRSRSHDWTDCPFSHPGEKARRRDPRRYHYSGTVCPEYRRSGDCTRGDECEFAHGVFECYLHPARYRTEACKDGKSCKRKVCFFAHSPRELRVLPLEDVERKETDVVQHEQHCSFMLRIRAARSVQLSSICDFGDDTQETTKAPELLEPANSSSVASKELSSKPEQTSFGHQNIGVSIEQDENLNPNLINAKTPTEESVDKQSNEAASCDKTCKEKSAVKEAAPDVKIEQEIQEKSVANRPSQDVCTPKPPTVARKGGRTTTESKRQQTAKKIASALKNPSALKSKIQSQTGSAKPAGVRRYKV